MKTFKSVLVSFIVFAFIAAGLTSCNNKGTHAQKNKEAAITQNVVKPDTLNMSKDTLALRVQQRTMKEIQKRQAKIAKEAVAVVTQTNNAISDLQGKHIKKAEEALRTAMENTKVLLKKNPNVVLFPVDESVSIHDLVTTIPQINKTIKTVKTLIAKGEYQEAAGLLNNLKSEMTISTVNLPIGNYPDGLKQAIKLLAKNKTNQAEQLLTGMMNSLVVNQVAIPLPILRAQVMMAESKMFFNKKEDKSKVVNLLENADYQLKLAQALGYGNFDKEYTTISKEIAQVKESVKNGNASNDIFEKLMKKTENFKNRIIKEGKKIKQAG